jgi:hypothetical protein
MEMNTDRAVMLVAQRKRVGWVERVLRRVFRDYPGSLAARDWNGDTLTFGDGSPEFTLTFRHPGSFRDLILFRDPLRLAEAHFRGEIDVDGDIYPVLALKDHLQALDLSAAERAAFLAKAALMHNGVRKKREARKATRSRPIFARWLRRHSRSMNRQAIAFHYDVSDAFYRLWLDEQMVYSCAYFETPADSLDQAQRNKLEHLCRKLRLKAGERLLDIGCGWGALLRWAAKHHGVQAHGITHQEDGWKKTLSTEFMNRYVFPDGELDSVSNVPCSSKRAASGSTRSWRPSARTAWPQCRRPDGTSMHRGEARQARRTRSGKDGFIPLALARHLPLEEVWTPYTSTSRR